MGIFLAAAENSKIKFLVSRNIPKLVPRKSEITPVGFLLVVVVGRGAFFLISFLGKLVWRLDANSFSKLIRYASCHFFPGRGGHFR